LRYKIDPEQQDLMDDATFAELDQHLIPMDSAVKTLGTVKLELVAEGFFRNGNPVFFSSDETHQENALVRVYSIDSGRFLGVGFIDDDGKVAPKRSVVWE
jgi:tRNA pseudouridine55 synthase